MPRLDEFLPILDDRDGRALEELVAWWRRGGWRVKQLLRRRPPRDRGPDLRLGIPTADIEPGEAGTFAEYAIEDGEWSATGDEREDVADGAGAGALTDERFLLVRVGGAWLYQPFGPLVRQATASETISAGGSGTARLHKAGADAGIDVTAHLDWAEGGEEVSSGKEVFVSWVGERFQITGAECE